MSDRDVAMRIAYEVVWAGRGPLVDGEGWRQRENPLSSYGHARGSLLSPHETAKAVRAPSWRQVNEAAPKVPPTYVHVQRAPNRLECACGRKLAKWEVAEHRPRCWRCTKAGRVIRKRAA